MDPGPCQVVSLSRPNITLDVIRPADKSLHARGICRPIKELRKLNASMLKRRRRRRLRNTVAHLLVANVESMLIEPS